MIILVKKIESYKIKFNTKYRDFFANRAYTRLESHNLWYGKTKNIKLDVSDVLKTVLFSTLISLGAVLIFAIIVRFASVPSKVILPVNIAIKIISVFVGALISFKNTQNGLVKGAIAGLLYMLFTFLVFGALTGFKDVKFSWIDLVTLPLAGALSGIVAVNVKSKKE